MKKTLVLAAVVMFVLLASTSMAFASNGNGPEYDLCIKEFMSPEDVARFEAIIDEYRAKMADLRGDPQVHDQRLSLKVEKRDALVEIVPDEFKDRFNNFNKEKQNMLHISADKGNGKKSGQ